MYLLPNFILQHPYVIEMDFSGVIIDQNDTEFSLGDGVYGMIHPG